MSQRSCTDAVEGTTSGWRTCDFNAHMQPRPSQVTHKSSARPHHSGLAPHSLLSVVKLYNAGCEVTFNKIGCIVKYRGNIVLTGNKFTKTGLWMVPVSDTTADPTSTPTKPPEDVLNHLEHAGWAQEAAANVHPTTSKPELAKYLNQILCSPPKSTLLKAIRNHQLDSIPGLTCDLIANHIPPSAATEKGHMIRTRQGLRSTQLGLPV